MGSLTIPVNGIYFDQIAAGTKIEEYRLVTPFWTRRIEGRSYDRVVLTRGYPKGGGIEGVTRLDRPWRGYVRRVLTHPHFGSEPVEVFAISVAPPAEAGSTEVDDGDR
jgi:hypothetical protein